MKKILLFVISSLLFLGSQPLSAQKQKTEAAYEVIEVDYLDQNFKKKHGKYTGWTAQIIQHEVDHCNGVVI